MLFTDSLHLNQDSNRLKMKSIHFPYYNKILTLNNLIYMHLKRNKISIKIWAIPGVVIWIGMVQEAFLYFSAWESYHLNRNQEVWSWWSRYGLVRRNVSLGVVGLGISEAQTRTSGSPPLSLLPEDQDVEFSSISSKRSTYMMTPCDLTC